MKNLQNHKSVFTTYLKEAQRDGKKIVENWIDWKNNNGIAQCEECKKYGDYGSEVRFEGDNGEILLCDECREIEEVISDTLITEKINNWLSVNGYSFFYLSDLEEIFDSVPQIIIDIVKGEYSTLIHDTNTFVV